MHYLQLPPWGHFERATYEAPFHGNPRAIIDEKKGFRVLGFSLNCTLKRNLKQTPLNRTLKRTLKQTPLNHTLEQTRG